METIDKIVYKFLIFIKRILTRLGLRNKQSCKCCGRNTIIEFHVDDKIWNKLPKQYHNKVLCIECFILLNEDMVFMDDIKDKIKMICISK